MTKLERIIEYFKAHPETFEKALFDLEDINGILTRNHRNYKPMDDLVTEFTAKYLDGGLALLEAIYYGFDNDTLEQFNPHRTYWYIDNDNRLRSTDTTDYSSLRNAHTITEMLKEMDRIITINNRQVLHSLFIDLLHESGRASQC